MNNEYRYMFATHHTTRHFTCCAYGVRSQRGVALVVALILLVVVTLIGLAAVGGTIMQNKMAANQYDRELAFQSSEAAMRAAGTLVQTDASTSQPLPAGVEDCSVPAGGTTPTNYCLANPFDDTNAAAYIKTVATTTFNSSSLAAAQPQYVVQYLGRFAAPPPKQRQISNASRYGTPPPSPTADYYRITARSGDPSNIGTRSLVVLQSVFRN